MQKDGNPPRPAWATSLLAALKVETAAGPAAVLAKAGEAADRLAPDTRRMWRWILALQGIAVLAPMTWLLVVRSGFAVSAAAYAVIVCTLLVVGVSWWLRWRGMQHAWAQARMVAEIARSMVSSRQVAERATVDALAASPQLQGLAAEMAAAANATPAMEHRQMYVEKRVEDQLHYYQRKHREATATRRTLSRYVTMALDGALFLAVAGVWISLNPSAERWLRLSGSDCVLGCVGAALPLIAILMQLLGSYLELNRRTGRYVQQVEFLESARDRILGAENGDEVKSVVTEVERVLLAEVVDWFYQAQHSEPYYRPRENNNEVREAIVGQRLPWLKRIFSWLGLSAGFIGRVVFGRVLVVALSVVLTTALIAFYTPKDSKETSRLRREDGRLLSSSTADSWEPDARRAGNGFILIAHGLHDSAIHPSEAKGELHWMAGLQRNIAGKLGDRCPEICLVDWHFAAVPAKASWAGFSTAATDTVSVQAWLQDVASIRPQGEEIGDLVGYKLARALRSGTLRADRPMHLIGHSAGGFVVVHAALVLQDLGLLPANSRVTLLDTPIPSVPDLAKLAEVIPVDFYRTSAFAKGVPASGFVRYFENVAIAPPAGTDVYTAAHSFAHQWYLRTVLKGEAEGFGRSPFAGAGK